jgi:tetratricopeptide (TPR) repeat protein
MRRSVARPIVLLVGALLFLPAATLVPASAPADSAPPSTRDAMGEIFASLQTLLLLSLEDGALSDPANATALNRALARLDEYSSELAQHGRGQADASFSFFSRSLADDARAVREHFRSGPAAESRRLLYKLVESCVGCHSRLPSRADPTLSARLTRDPRVVQLPLDERVRLEVATRQFDAALLTYEAILVSPDFSPQDMELLGILDDYLELCLQVRGDIQRARAALQRLSKRSDVPEALRRDLREREEALASLGKIGAGSDLARARALVLEGEAIARERPDRSGIVQYLAASGILHRILADETRTPHELAEAYYLLSVASSRVGRVYWPSPEELYLESAIELAPGSDTARDAYRLLEELVTFGYTGSAGTRIPPELRAKLDALKRLAYAEASPE